MFIQVSIETQLCEVCVLLPKRKAGFYKAFSNVDSQIGGDAAEEVLLASVCLTILFYVSYQTVTEIH